VVQRFVALASNDPMTAPVPAVDIDARGRDYDALRDFGPDLGARPDARGDAVFIRAGQAGVAKPESGSAKARQPKDDRQQGRSGRLKLRRRPQDS